MSPKKLSGPTRLLAWRTAKRLTQREVAEQLSVSTQVVTSYETGRIIPGLKRAVDIAVLTGYQVKPEHWLTT
jgi:transcriptional regulator with XRE-family HTH domain